MIAARVANGLAVAAAAAAEASGASAAAMAGRTMPAAHMIMRRGSRRDVILADSLVFLGVVSCMFPPFIGKLPAYDLSDGRSPTE